MTDSVNHVMILDGVGGATFGSEEKAAVPGVVIWRHFDLNHPGSVAWINEQSGFDDSTKTVMLDDQTRPRFVPQEHGLTVILRGANFNPHADIDDMVSIRVHLEPRQIVTSRHRKLHSIRDIVAAYQAGNGPTSPGGFLASLAHRLTERIRPVVDTVEERMEVIDDALLEKEHDDFHDELLSIRRRIIKLRRYLVPQAITMAGLLHHPTSLLDNADRVSLRETHDDLLRLIEDLDACRDRTTAAAETIAAAQAISVMRHTYLLTILAGMFIPLGFFTGLLGVNVGGIPGAEDPLAFWELCGLLGGFLVVEVMVFRLLKWI
jgi:zinc transporter